MPDKKIPLVILEMQSQASKQHYSKAILENEVKDVRVEHVSLTANKTISDSPNDKRRNVYLFIDGTGKVLSENMNQGIVSESILVPGQADTIKIKPDQGSVLNFVKITCSLSEQDQKYLAHLPSKNVQETYLAKFSECEAYSESIKSANTVSRTILSNEYIPRVAMGTVKTKGPDEVAAHEHPMLEQLFLGLSGNNCRVYADDTEVSFPQHSMLHVPLGSNHSVSVDADDVMYYVWMDFFLDRKGEAWLENHKVVKDN